MNRSLYIIRIKDKSMEVVMSMFQLLH